MKINTKWKLTPTKNLEANENLVQMRINTKLTLNKLTLNELTLNEN